MAEVRFKCICRGLQRIWDHEWQFADYIHIRDAVLTASFADNHRIAYILNSHGDLYQVPIRLEGPCKEFLVSTGERTALLYSAHIKYIKGRIIVAAGSAFGDITVWSIDAATAVTGHYEKRYHVLCETGSNGDRQSHAGAIFGLQLSNEVFVSGRKVILLVSCSDDWTIRTWSLGADLRRIEPQEISTLSSDNLHLTRVGHHGSRVWSVRFVKHSFSKESRQTTHISLVSVGENLQCRQWHLDAVDAVDGDELQPVVTDKAHRGKHIWSVAQRVSKDKNQELFTGGADGAVISRSSGWPEGAAQSQQQSLPVAQILPDTGADSTRQMSSRGNLSIKQLHFFDYDCLLALTDSGVLLQGLITQGPEQMQGLRWSVLSALLYQAIVAISKMPLYGEPEGFTFVADTNGNIIQLRKNSGKWLCHFVTNVEMTVSTISALGYSGTQYCLVVYSSDRKTAVLLRYYNLQYPVEKQSLELPVGFTCSGVSLLHQGGKIVLGSRQGSLAIYRCDMPDAAELKYDLETCVRHVHGKETVTSLSRVPKPVTSLFPSSSVADFKVPDLFVSTGRDGKCVTHRAGKVTDHNGIVDVSTSPFLGGFEGAFYNHVEGPLQGPVWIYFGFREYDFVIWNETSQLELARIPCGGAHRTWSFNPVDFSFAWTKNGNFNLYGFTKPLHTALQMGGHGREIKALAVSRSMTPGHLPSAAGRKLLVATGAEDTTIRLLFAPLDSAEENLTCSKILSAHTTGIQHLAFSSCGQYLFSSGGCEELFVWLIEHGVPGIGLGVRLEFTFPKGSADQSDLRITNFQIQDERMASGTDIPPPNFIIAAVYSNSMIRFLQYRDDQQGGKETCTVLRQLFYHENCITQIHWRRHVLTGSTDGRIALWDSLGHGLTHGKAPVTSRQVHQNSITAMRVIPVRTDKPEIDLIITGGDDNALGLTLRHYVDEHYAATRVPVFEVLLLPDAHAAAITAVCLVHCHFAFRYVVSGPLHRNIGVVALHLRKMGFPRQNLTCAIGSPLPHR